MDLDDSFTEKLFQRSKARREFISEKKYDVSVGRKRVALSEEQQINSSSPIKPKESPKRQCIEVPQTAYSPHDKENFEKQGADSNAAFVPFHSGSKAKGLAALKKNFIEDDNGNSKLKATSEPQNSPAIVNSIKLTETAERTAIKTYPSENDRSSDDESIDANDFAENYQDINSEHENAKMELDYSPVQSMKRLKNSNSEPKPNEVKKPNNPVLEEPVNKNVDPAELPLSARKALFEKALLCGTPKLNDEVIDHKLSVAERAAMFENASKVNMGSKNVTNFKQPKKITLSNFSEFNKHSNSQLVKSPIKTVQHPPKVDEEIKGSPVKKVISAPVTSTPSPTKNVGNHTRFIQQKLIQNSNSNWQDKEIISKASEQRKQEISSLVNHWEKLSSSSSVENNSEMSEMERNNSEPQEHVSYESDVVKEPSECDEEYNSDCENDDNAEEKDDNYSDNGSESDVAENVFELEDAETGSMKSLEENYDHEQTNWQREDIQSVSSESAKSLVSSTSFSGISSYSDDSNYNASKSQSCTSGSSVGSYDLTSSDMAEGTSESSKENKNGTPLLYTVSFYRKQKQETRLTPVRTVVRREKVNSPESSSDRDFTEIIQERIKALHEEVLRQQTVISQTSQALNLCTATAEFSGSTEQVEGEKLLLIATQKRQALLNEITRIKTCGAQGENVADGTGTLIIADIQLPLKREFMASQLEGKGTDTVHYFLCLIRHGPQVIVTQMMSTDDKVTDGALCFTNHIKLQNLPADFSIVFEVYALQTKKEVLPHEKKYHIKREHSKIRLTPKGRKLDGKILMPAVSSPGGPNAVRSSSFGVIGYTRFTLQNCNKKTFTLDKVPFTSPLEGVLRVKLQLHAEHKVMEKGFLTMFEDVSGFGAWHRRWCALDAHRLAYWKYPDDEHKKEPIGAIDLKQCVTGQVRLISRDVCARPHTFQLVTIRPQAKGDKNTLISRSVNTLTTTKHLLSADTKDERILWCNKLNEALTNARKWDPQALRPVETMQDCL